MIIEQEVRYFHAFGFLSIRQLLTPEEVEVVSREFDAALLEERGGKPFDGKKRQQTSNWWKGRQEVEYLSTDTRIREPIAQLLGPGYVFKANNDGNLYVGDTSWHPDLGWDPNIPAGRDDPYRLEVMRQHYVPSIKVAFYLDPVEADSGCLRVIPGAHKSPYHEKLWSLHLNVPRNVEARPELRPKLLKMWEREDSLPESQRQSRSQGFQPQESGDGEGGDDGVEQDAVVQAGDYPRPVSRQTSCRDRRQWRGGRIRRIRARWLSLRRPTISAYFSPRLFRIPELEIQMPQSALYKSLGVRPLINAYGTMTHIGGSIMSPEVTAAMVEAAKCFVPLEDLQARIGERLAAIAEVEAAFVSSGAASGMMLAGAACLTDIDEDSIKRLPDVGDRPNEFIISLVDDHTYVHQSLRLCGGKLAEVGSTEQVSADDYAAAVGDRTAAMVVFLGMQSKQQLAEVIDIAHASGLPVIVDAAAQLPPRSNLREVPAMGADLVVFSGGKAIGGPQSTGLVLGRRDLVRACALNSSPHFAAGRGMKVGKEELVGLLRAVELMMERDEEALVQDWEAQCREITALVGEPAGVTVEFNPYRSHSFPASAPFLRLRFDGDARISAAAAAKALDEGDPCIMVGLVGDSFTITPQTLQPGEAAIIGRRLAEILAG